MEIALNRKSSICGAVDDSWRMTSPFWSHLLHVAFNLSLYIQICMYVCLSACLPACLYVCMYIYMYIRILYVYSIYCIICMYYIVCMYYMSILYVYTCVYIYDNSVCCDLSNRITSRLPVPSLLHRALLEQAQASKGLAPQTVGPNGFLQENTPEVYEVYPVWWYFTHKMMNQWESWDLGIPNFQTNLDTSATKVGGSAFFDNRSWMARMCSLFQLQNRDMSRKLSEKMNCFSILKSPNSQNRLLSSTFIVNLENCVTAFFQEAGPAVPPRLLLQRSAIDLHIFEPVRQAVLATSSNMVSVGDQPGKIVKWTHVKHVKWMSNIRPY